MTYMCVKMSSREPKLVCVVSQVCILMSCLYERAVFDRSQFILSPRRLENLQQLTIVRAIQKRVKNIDSY